MTSPSKPNKMQRTPQRPMLLEPRIVFDAAVAATGSELIDHNSDHTDHTPPAVAAHAPVEAVKEVSTPVRSTDTDARAEGDAGGAAKTQGTVITFIDSNVENIQAAIVGYPGEVIVLQAGQDGVDQIAAALAGRTNVSAIHIISHGSAGELELGTGVLNSFTMAGRYASDMEAIKNALTEDGDILLYGCDVAGNTKGAAFLAQMARVTGADIEGSIDATGSFALGGNWTLEHQTGKIEATALRDDQFDGVLATAASNGEGALLAVSGNVIYSVDMTTGKAFALTTVPNNVGGVAIGTSINSLAVDHDNGLLYYTDGASSATNLALFAYDYVNNTHILIDANMTDNGAGKSIFVGARGVGSGSATFANGVLYFGVEKNKNGATNSATGNDSAVYTIQLTGGGRVINSVTELLVVPGGDWGDIGYDHINNTLVSVAVVNGTSNTFTRYNPTTGAIIGATTVSAGPASSQMGETLSGKTYFVTSAIQRYDANTANAALIGGSITITTASGAGITAVSDGAGYTPETGVIGDKVFFDNNGNGTFDAGVDIGAAGVTVQLIKDVNNNGVVDTGDNVLATDTTTASGDYSFTNVLPGNYIIRVTDTANVLGVNASHPYTQTGTSNTRGDADVATIGGNLLTIDFGVKNSVPVASNDTVAATEDNAITFDVRTNDVDADGDTLTVNQINGVALVAGGAGVAVTGGVVTLNVAGTLTFTPTANFNGPSTFSYQVADRTGTTANGSVTVNVASVNDAPAGTNATLTAAEDTPRTFTASDFGFSDVNDSPANTLQSVVIASLPSGGTIRFNGTPVTVGQEFTVAQLAQLTFTAAANANGNAYTSFTFQVRDNGGTASGGVDLDQSPNTLTFNVTAVNDAPTQTVPATFITNEDTAMRLAGLSIGDVDANGGSEQMTLTVDSGILTATASGGVTVAGSGSSTLVLTGSVANLNAYLAATASQPLFTPTANFTGSVQLAVSTDDGGNTGTDPGTSGTPTSESVVSVSSITVVSINDAPAGTNATLTVVEDTSRTFTASDFGFSDANDTPANTFQSVVITTLPTQGALRLNGTPVTAGQEITVAQLAQLTYTAGSNANGTGYTSFTFQVRDNGGTVGGGVDLDQSPNTIVFNVTSVNDAPSGTDATVTAVEDTARTFTPADFGFSDANDSPANTLQSVVITTLPTNGVIRFNGTPIAAGQEFTVAQLAQLTFTAATNANGSPYATFTFQVRDNGGTANGGVDLDQSPNTLTVNVTPVNDAPVLAVGNTLAYTENQAATAIDPNLTVTDIDSATLTGATVALAAGFNAGQDVLAFTNQNGISGSYNAGTGVLTLSGTATVAQYQTALRSVTYLNTSDNPNTTARTVNYQVNDGQALSNVQASTITVAAVNDAPTQTVPGAQTGTEDAALAIAGISVSDLDSSTLTTTVSVLHGTLSVSLGGGATIINNGTGSVGLQGTAAQINAALAGLAYTNTADYNGADTLSVVTSDGSLSSGTSTVAINVAPVVDIASDTATTPEDTVVNINVNANDTFENAGHTITAINGTPIAVNGTVSVANGVVTLKADGTLDFAPALNYNNATPTTFTYTVTSGGVSETATVSVTVTPVNDNPVANPNTATTTINTALTNINVLANDTDVDGDTLSVTNATVNAAQGTVTVNGNGTLNFTPASNFTGAAVVTYTISDGKGGTASSTLTVNVGGNTPPDSADRTLTTTEDTAFTLATGNFAFNDADAGQTLQAVRIDALPTNGALLLNGAPVTTGQVISAGNIAAGLLTFTPSGNANGTNYANFTFSVQDSAGAFDTAPNRITFNVTPVNDNPVATSDLATTPEDTPLTIATATLLGNDSDVDGDALTISSVQGAVNGTVVLSGTNVVFTPNANYHGPASFTYTVSDGNGGTATATVNITVTSVNDNPVANADTATTALNVPATVNVLGNDTDVDGDTLSVTSANVNPAQGTVVVNGNGTLTFTPANNASGPATITYSIADGNGGTATGTLTITVGANTPPDSANVVVTTPEDTSLTLAPANFAFTDADAGQTLQAVRIDSLATNGTLTLSGIAVTPGQIVNIGSITAGNLRFVPAANANGTAYASFTFSVQDSGGAFDTTPNTVTINVTAVNDTPVAVNDAATTAEDTPLIIARTTLVGNDTDVDGDTLIIASVQGAVNGTVALSGTNVVFTPNANYHGPASFTYTVTDPSGATSTATVNITVTSVNDNPVANGDAATTSINTTLANVNVLGNDTDVDGDTLSVTSATVNAAQGTVTVNGNGTLNFVPANNFTGPATITYTIADGNGGTATGILTVNIGANTPPNSANVTVTAVEDTPLVLSTANFAFTDADAGQTMQGVRIDSLPAAGVLRLNGVSVTAGQVIAIADINAGNMRFVPAANANGTAYANFNFSVQDSAGAFDTTPNTVTINVTAVNDAPVAVNDAATTAEDTPLTLTPATLLANDTDVDGDTLTIASVQGAVNGTVALVGGNVVFTPNANYNGPASFTYTASDASGATSTATVNVTVTSVNDNPVANADSATTPVNVATVPLNVLANDTDVDGNPLTVTNATVNAAQGSVVINPDSTITFTPAANVTGPVVINYTIGDGQGGTATSTLTVFIGANTAPNSADATVTTLEDTPIALTPANFVYTDADAGQSLIGVRIDSLPASGTLRLNGAPVTVGQTINLADLTAGNLRFAPAANANGVAYTNFTFSVQDSGGAYDLTPNTLTVNVTPVNDAPVAVNDAATTAEDTPLTLAPGALLGNDTDVDGDTLTIASVQGAVNGTVALVGGNVVFTPNANYNGPASFTYTATDASGATSTATVNITVTAVNDNPVANGDAASTTINTALANINVLGNDTDVDGDTLSVTSATVNAAQGTVTTNPDGTLNFTPANNFTGPATITYAISDGHGGTATATLTVNVGANTPPDSANVGASLDEDTTVTFSPGAFFFTDADAGQTLQAVRIDTLPSSGTLFLAGVPVTAGQVVSVGSIFSSQLTYTPALNATGGTSFTYSVQDSAGAFDLTPNTYGLNVTPINDAPVLSVGNTLVYTENQAATAIDPGLVVNDVDSATLTGATVSIGAGFNAAQDVLAFTNQNGITGSYNAATGVLTLTGTATVAQYQTALRSVAYANTSDAPSTTARTINYQVNDGQALNNLSNVQTSTVTVAAVNDNPVANNDVATTAINAPLANIAVLGNDTDVEGNTLTVTSATVNAAQGTVTTNPDGTLNFTPATNFTGPAIITYAISDGNGGTATATLTVNVGANTPPNSVDAALSATEDTPLALGIANFAFTDADAGQTLQAVRIDSLPTNGSLQLNGAPVALGQLVSSADIAAGRLVFTPAANANDAGYATLTFSVQDSGGAFDTAPNTLTFNVVAVNDAPVATTDTLAATEDTPLVIAPATLLGNDIDVDGDTLTVASVQSAVNGTVALVGGNVVFTPNANYNGPASFTYTVVDPSGATSTATVNITVAAVNDNPVANPDVASTAINTALANINVLGNDTDVDGDTLAVTNAAVNASQGVVTINGNGTLTFVPTSNFTGPATITYVIGDGKGGTSTATLTVNVGNNTPPDSADATLAVVEDTPLVLTPGNFAFTDADAGQSLANVRIDSIPTNGTLVLNGATLAAGQIVSVADIAAGNLRFAPAANANGTPYSSLTFSVQDSAGAFDTAPNTLTFNVTPVNDAPVANVDTVTATEDTPLVIAPATLLDNDIDVDGDTLTIASVQGAVNGTVAIVGGNVVFTPNANYNGPASFTYTVVDPSGAASTATVNVTVAAVNDLPVANPDAASTPINTPLANINVLGNDTDVDGNTLSVTNATVNPAQGSATVNPDGTLAFTPASNFTGPVTVTYTVSDGNGGTTTGTLTVNVGTNTPPTSANATVVGTEDTALVLTPGNFSFTDADAGQTLQAVRIDTLPTNGSLLLNGVPITPGQLVSPNDIAAGNLRFVPGPNANGVGYTGFTFSVQDSGGAFSAIPNTITLDVAPVNDAPVVNGDSLTTPEDTPLVIAPATLLGDDSDVDGDTLAIVSVQGAVGGSVALVGGNVVFTPNPNYNGAASFTYTVSDGHGGAATATVNIAVSPVDDGLSGNLNHDATNDTGTSSNDDVTKNPSPAIVGAATPGDTITLYGPDGVTVIGTTVADAQGNWSIDPNGPYLSEGVNNLIVTATDPNGNESAGVPVQITLDTTASVPPGIVITEDTNQDGIIDPSELQGPIGVDILLPVGTKAGDTVRVTDGTVTNVIVLSPTDIANGKVSTTFDNPGEGKAIGVTASITDAAGNVSMTTSATSTVYTTPPVARDDAVTAPVRTPLVIDPALLLENDSAASGRTIALTSVQDAVNGTVAIVDGKIVFTPSPGFIGNARFTYTVGDGTGKTATGSVTVSVLPEDDRIPEPRPVQAPPAPRPNIPAPVDHALHVEHSVSAVRAEANLRSGLGVFFTDSATAAELMSDTAMRPDSLTDARSQEALFVQHAVRHEALTTDPTLFVQNAVRASQLEALGRNVRINSMNSAVTGVDTLLDPFALGSQSGAKVYTDADKDNSNADKAANAQDSRAVPAPQQARATVSEAAMPLPPEAEKTAPMPVKRRAADSFASQLRQNASSLRHNTLRPEPKSPDAAPTKGMPTS